MQPYVNRYHLSTLCFGTHQEIASLKSRAMGYRTHDAVITYPFFAARGLASEDGCPDDTSNHELDLHRAPAQLASS